MPYFRRLLLTFLLAVTLGPVLARFELGPYVQLSAALLHGFSAYDDAYISTQHQDQPAQHLPERLLTALLAAALGSGACTSGLNALPILAGTALLGVPAEFLLNGSLALLSLSAATLLRLRP